MNDRWHYMMDYINFAWHCMGRLGEVSAATEHAAAPPPQTHTHGLLCSRVGRLAGVWRVFAPVGSLWGRLWPRLLPLRRCRVATVTPPLLRLRCTRPRRKGGRRGGGAGLWCRCHYRWELAAAGCWLMSSWWQLAAGQHKWHNQQIQLHVTVPNSAVSFAFVVVDEPECSLTVSWIHAL